MLISSLLFYQKLREYLEAIGFKVNPYDPCVSKNMICDEQITVTWHVNYLKLSLSDKNIVNYFIQWNKDTYEDITKLKLSREKIHDYTSMTLDYTTSGEVEIYMK